MPSGFDMAFGGTSFQFYGEQHFAELCCKSDKQFAIE